MNLNLPSDIEKKVDHVIISLPFKDLSLQNLLKNRIPSENSILLEGAAQKFRIVPGDGSGLQFNQRPGKPGAHWSFDFDFNVLENTNSNFAILNRFSNKRIVLFIGTSTYIYQLGYKDQLLNFSFRENLTGYRVSISGELYFPAARKLILSFRSSF